MGQGLELELDACVDVSKLTMVEKRATPARRAEETVNFMFL